MIYNLTISFLFLFNFHECLLRNISGSIYFVLSWFTLRMKERMNASCRIQICVKLTFISVFSTQFVCIFFFVCMASLVYTLVLSDLHLASEKLQQFYKDHIEWLYLKSCFVNLQNVFNSVFAGYVLIISQNLSPDIS